MNESLIAINIVMDGDSGQKILLNKNSTPILFYYNGDGTNVSEAIKNDEKFKNLVKEKITSYDIYIKSNVCHIYYTYDGSDNYKEESISFQKFIPIEEIGDNFLQNIIDEMSKKIYFDVFKKEYGTDEKKNDSIICDVYIKANITFKNKITPNIFLNYLRKKLFGENNFTLENTDKILSIASAELEKVSGQKYY